MWGFDFRNVFIKISSSSESSEKKENKSRLYVLLGGIATFTSSGKLLIGYVDGMHNLLIF
jgi:hypothetical protein